MNLKSIIDIIKIANILNKEKKQITTDSFKLYTDFSNEYNCMFKDGEYNILSFYIFRYHSVNSYIHDYQDNILIHFSKSQKEIHIKQNNKLISKITTEDEFFNELINYPVLSVLELPKDNIVNLYGHSLVINYINNNLHGFIDEMKNYLNLT